MKQIYKIMISIVIITLISSIGMAAEVKEESTITSTTHDASYVPVVTQEIMSGTAGASSVSSALLIQDILPWNKDNDTFALKEAGISYDLTRSSDLASLDIRNYKFIIYASDQPVTYYQNINGNIAKIEEYVTNGGILVGHVADRGFGGGDWTGLRILPGGVGHVFETSNNLNILDPDSLLFSGLPSGYFDNWDWSTHGYFTGLPVGTRELVSYSGGTKPTYVEYAYGKGKVLSTMQTYEWSQVSGVPVYPIHIIKEFKYAEYLADSKYARWSTVASAGAVDEADTGIFDFNSPYATVKSTATLPAYLNIRYNVDAIDGVPYGNKPGLKVRYRDTGTSSAVTLYLKEYNITSGSTTVRMSFDSNDYAQGPSYVIRTKSYCNPGWTFDFSKNVYYVDTQLSKTAATASPGLAAVQLTLSSC